MTFLLSLLDLSIGAFGMLCLLLGGAEIMSFMEKEQRTLCDAQSRLVQILVFITMSSGGLCLVRNGWFDISWGQGNQLGLALVAVFWGGLLLKISPKGRRSWWIIPSFNVAQGLFLGWVTFAPFPPL